MASSSVTLSADFSAVVSLLSDPPDALAEAVHRGLDLGEFLAQAFSFEADDLTAGAGELVMRAYPTDWLRGFLAAGGAGNFQLMSVEKSGHDEDSKTSEKTEN
jgi:hypothetical protein